MSELEQLCAAASGAFLDDLDLANCDEFNAWRIATVRGRPLLARPGLTAELVSRDLPPDRLLPYVRAWVEREPA